MILFYNGNFIRVINSNDNLDVDIPAWFALEFAGAFLAILFWVGISIIYSAHESLRFCINIATYICGVGMYLIEPTIPLLVFMQTPVMMLWFFYDVDVTFRKA